MTKKTTEPTLDNIVAFLADPSQCGYEITYRPAKTTPPPPRPALKPGAPVPFPVQMRPTPGSFLSDQQETRQAALFTAKGKPPESYDYSILLELRAALETAGYGQVSEKRVREALRLLFIRRGVPDAHLCF